MVKFEFFKPKNTFLQRKRKFDGETYWFVGQYQNKIQAEVAKGNLIEQHGYHCRIEKIKSGPYVGEYNLWAR
jgi:hypothetical protein